jgi:hypothetical protein
MLTALLLPVFFVEALAADARLADSLPAETQSSGEHLATKSQARELYIRSGMEDMIQRFPALLKDGVAGGLSETGQEDEAFARQLSDIIDAAVDTRIMGEEIQQHLASGLSGQQLSVVMAWLNTQVGEKVVSLEKKAVTRESVKEMEAQVVELQRKYKGSERERQFHAFDKATGLTESSLETAMAVQISLAGAFAGAGEGQTSFSYDQLEEMVEANRFMTRGLIGQQVYTSFLYTYESLSPDEMRAYIEFAQSSEGSRYFTTVNTAIRDVLIPPSREIGKNIMRVALESQ